MSSGAVLLVSGLCFVMSVGWYLCSGYRLCWWMVFALFRIWCLVLDCVYLVGKVIGLGIMLVLTLGVSCWLLTLGVIYYYTYTYIISYITIIISYTILLCSSLPFLSLISSSHLIYLLFLSSSLLLSFKVYVSVLT